MKNGTEKGASKREQFQIGDKVRTRIGTVLDGPIEDGKIAVGYNPEHTYVMLDTWLLELVERPEPIRPTPTPLLLVQDLITFYGDVPLTKKLKEIERLLKEKG